MKKTAYIIAGLIIVLFAVFTVSKDTQETTSGQPIVLGAAISLSGPAASFGEFARNGIQLAIDEINKAGGMDGRMIKVVYEDDHTDPKATVSAFNKLVCIDKVDGVIGGLWDFVAQPIFPLALANKTAFISPSNFRIEGSFELNDQSFVMLTDFNKVIRALTDYLKRDDVKKIAVVHFKSTFGEEIAKTIKTVAHEIGKGPIIDESYGAINSNDFKTTIVKLKQQNVNTVFLDMVDMDTVNFLTRSKELGFKPTFITYVGSYDAFKPENKSLLEGVVVLNWEVSAPAFTEKYKKVYGHEPAKGADRAYGAVYILAEAIAKTKSKADVASYIESHSFKTINGTIKFLPTHQVENTPVQIDVYTGGKLVPLK